METFTILISDRNGNVRELLRREMSAEGYLIRTAKNGKEVLKWLYKSDPVDLIIIDPELPGVTELDIFQKIDSRVPSLPVIVHAFSEDYMAHNHHVLESVYYVEKKENSVDRLKQVASNILKNRFLKKSTVLTN